MSDSGVCPRWYRKRSIAGISRTEARPQRDLLHRSLSKKYQELSGQFCTQSKPSSRSLPRVSITAEAMAVGGTLTIIVDAVQIADPLLADCFR
jgi:hypothetical protein